MDKPQLDDFNKKLVSEFGYFSNGQARFRLVWSEDQLEKRFTNYTPEGFYLINAEVTEVPKYKQWIHERYVLEQLVPIPENHSELAVGKLSYEPLWVFQNKASDYLEPKFEAAKFIINVTLGNMASYSNSAKYHKSSEETRQERIQEVNEIEEMLYGNESKVGDALARDNAVGYGIRQRNDSFNPIEKVIKSGEV